MDKIEVRDGPIIKHIYVEGERAVEAMRELEQRLGMVEFYSTPTLSFGKGIDGERTT